MKRITWIGLILIALIVGFYFFGFSEPPEGLEKATVEETTEIVEEVMDAEKIPFQSTQVNFNFEGYGPGKEHLGTFTNYEGNLHMKDDEIVGVDFTIDASSVDTGIGRLNTHLQSDDFFDVEKYPEIEFTSTSLTEDTLEGDLLFRGVTKHLAIPITREDSMISADFLLDVTEFDFKYVGINKDVRIMFEFGE